MSIAFSTVKLNQAYNRMHGNTYFIKQNKNQAKVFHLFSKKFLQKRYCVVFNPNDWNWKIVRFLSKMFSKLVLTSVAIILVSVFSPTIASPLAAVREQAHDANTLANLRGFMSDLKSKLRGELALLMALEEEEEEQGKQGLNICISIVNTFPIKILLCDYIK